ncbi:TetR/AcrR family transcriptional regulator [Mycolicibacter icosiumassiliensis]|uniref:TetR/AcrR family transcriptional regulator n=1 Tax=Mycolicibacter icosiumassiliensis TaxID=1792835 RepID=UPI00082C981B|nr:TetR/AcrR family transcriptional regulator [Mycolicibacter icosiumassiliensis]
MTGLRERKKADTRRALSDAALQLTLERGLENVTREDIAGLAGVSPRTFSNYFSTKYEALAYRQTERLRRSVALLRERPDDEPLWTSITEAIVGPVQDDFAATKGDAYGPPDRARLAVLRSALTDRDLRNSFPRSLFDDFAAAIAERTGTDPHRNTYPRLVAAVVHAVVEATIDSYVTLDPPVAYPQLLRAAFADVAAGLPAPADRKV